MACCTYSILLCSQERNVQEQLIKSNMCEGPQMYAPRLLRAERLGARNFWICSCSRLKIIGQKRLACIPAPVGLHGQCPCKRRNRKDTRQDGYYSENQQNILVEQPLCDLAGGLPLRCRCSGSLTADLLGRTLGVAKGCRWPRPLPVSKHKALKLVDA